MSRFLPGNRVDLLRNGDEFFPALKAAIDGARHDIQLETYIFRIDTTTRPLAEALVAAARRGVAAVMVWPNNTCSRPRTVVSTSGSSGIAWV